MINRIARRSFVLGAGLSLAAFGKPTRAQPGKDDPFAALEAEVGGRIGVAALDTGRGRRLFHRDDERFAMCSTFKWILAAAILAKVDRGQIALDRLVPYGHKDLLSYAPVTTAHVSEGTLPLETLCAAAVEQSDNTAANLLLSLIGGPAGLTAFVRRAGDVTTRLDRDKPSLNTNLSGDVRDTTTPNAMIATMQNILLGRVLSGAARGKLLDWMKDCKTGLARLRAGLPHDWSVGDKTGAGSNGAVNDLAITWPPSRPPILVAVYMSGSPAASEVLEAAHAKIGRIVGAAFA